MQAIVTKNITVTQVKVPPWMPKSRAPMWSPKVKVLPPTLRRLTISIRDKGLKQPIIISTNNVLIKGLRRLRACQFAGKMLIPAIVLDVTDDEAKDLYASMTDTTARVRGVEKLAIWLKEPKAVSRPTQLSYERAEKILGRKLLIRMKKSGYGISVYNLASIIACSQNGDAVMVRRLTRWMVANHCVGQCNRAMNWNSNYSRSIWKHCRAKRPFMLPDRKPVAAT